jgi:hypothetical protein
MKIDVNVKLYYNDITGHTYTEEELKAEIAEDVENEIAELKCGDFQDYNCYFEDFLRKEDLSPLYLVDCMFDKDEAECLVDRYAKYLLDRFTEGRHEELCVIEKKIQVEI